VSILNDPSITNPAPQTRLDSLTEAQKSLMTVWRDKWIAIGLSTAEADHKMFEEAAQICYKAAKLAPFKRVVWVKSPAIMAQVAPRAAVILARGKASKDQRRAGLPTDEVRKLVDEAIGRASVDAELNEVTMSDITNMWGRYIGGQFWVGGWYLGSPASVSYMHDVCGLDLGDLQERAEAYAKTAMSCSWWWPHTEFIIACDRPRVIARDGQGRLHREDGPAVEYRDGWGVYSWHGVAVPADVILHPESITVVDIEKTTNVEIRRVKTERYGHGRYIEDSGAKKLHEDEFGVLYRKDIPNDEPLVMVRVKNTTPEADGTYKFYYLTVHPELRPLLGGNRFGEPQSPTARNAVASTFGLRGEEYAPSRES